MIDNKDMPFIDHISEFRNRFFKVLVAHIIVILLAFSQSGRVLEELAKLNTKMQLVFIEPVEIMTTYVQISLVIALVLCFPYTLYHIWSFVALGLYESEKKILRRVLAMGFLFFLAGSAFGYFVMVPTSLKFFTRIAVESVTAMISMRAYVSFILTMVVLMGVVFNMPSLIFLLTRFGLISPKVLKEYRKIIILIIFLLSAFVTPPDLVSQVMVGLPMVALFEFSVFISTKVYRGDLKGGKTDAG